MSVQSMEALKAANRVRLGQAATKRDIKAGRVSVCALLDDFPAMMGSVPLLDLLKAQRQWGDAKALQTMLVCSVPEAMRLGEATVLQRRRLREYLA